MAHVTVLPGVQTPLRDEALDGWIEHLAVLNGTKATWIASLFELADDRSPYRWVRAVSDDTAAHIEAVTGVPAETIHDMTLARYAHLGLQPERARGSRSGGTWARAAGARFCPACLTERDHRWDIRWYTTWHFACQRHRIFLADRCPACGTIPRTFTRAHGSPDCPGGCAVRLLEEAADPATPEDSDLWTAQVTLDGLIGTPTSIVSLGRPVTPFVYLKDVAALARKAILRLDTHDLRSSVLLVAGEEAWTAWGEILSRELEGSRDRTVPDRLAAAAASSPVTAFGATVAVRALAESDPAEARKALAWCIESRHLALRQEVSTDLFDVLDPTPSTARTCRFIVTHAHEDRPPTEAAIPPLDPSQVPTGLWPPVANALLGSDHDDFKRLSLSSALLSVGEPGHIAEGVRRLDMEHVANARAARTWADLATAPEARDTIGALIALHRTLKGGPQIPIDYARRRRTFNAFEPLSMKMTRRLGRDSGQRATPSLQHFAGWWVTETLSGTPAMLTPQLMDLPGGIKRRYRAQRDIWDVQPPPLLLQRAEAALLRNRIDEPIRWSPLFDAQRATWTIPPPETTRTLPGWTTRTLRRDSETRPHITLAEGAQWAERLVSQAFNGARGLHRNTRRRLLRLVAADQHFSLRETADCLGITSATMSMTIRSLEHEIGRTLLEGASRGKPLRLTEDGRAILDAIATLHPDHFPSNHTCQARRTKETGPCISAPS